MAEPSVLEKVRMCVAEAGYDPGHVHLIDEEVEVDIHETKPEFGVPTAVAWRAFGVPSADDAQPCLACYLSFVCCDACLADRRLVLDCGRTR